MSEVKMQTHPPFTTMDVTIDDEEALKQAVGIVLEGFTLPDAARKILETAYFAEAALAQQSDVPEINCGNILETCEWTQDQDNEMGDTYHSSCGELWSFIDGGPKENRVSYCHHCGKPVKLAAAPKGVV